jgi:periplasmic divalent cation tolerance protein
LLISFCRIRNQPHRRENNMGEELLVFTTVPDEETAEKISQLLVEKRLAACVTRTSACKSVYWWKGKITKDIEHILFIKTQAKRYPALEKTLVKAHPYEVPEVIAVPLIKGFGKYLDWLNEETDPAR